MFIMLSFDGLQSMCHQKIEGDVDHSLDKKERTGDRPFRDDDSELPVPTIGRLPLVMLFVIKPGRKLQASKETAWPKTS